ncbi:hypothetical protein JI752_017970 [Lysobacter sp. MMG2]|uniref:hypothetical protein n=1 Tax=Lysobacter sp. MMG2 TaxID=2801338 RepID=UPI001C2273BD|nr:hypothetical protein [Lysobacter sp. MMG2]MBU8978040.1 hypothetical protein [Lysobacter sp. MMG2]
MKNAPTWLTAALLLAACQQTSTPAPADAASTPPPTQPAATTPAPATGTAPPARALADAAIAAVPPPRAQAPGDEQTNAAIDKALGDHAQYEPFIREFQSAVVRGDKAAVAGMVDYPFTATVEGKKKTIPDASAFVADYEDIFSPAIVQAVRNQKYAELFVSYRGVMFGNGEVWINGICHADSADCSRFDVRVVTIQPGPG